MLFIIWFINLNFYVILDYKNSKFKNLIDDIAIDLWSYWNFANMKDIRRKCNPMVNLSQFTLKKKILSGVVVLVYDNAWMISGLKLSSTLPKVANKPWNQRQIKGDRWRPAKTPPMIKLVSLWLTLKEKFLQKFWINHLVRRSVLL